MNVILKPRGFGKSSDLVRLSAETNIPIVCAYPPHVKFLAEEIGVEIPTPIRVNDIPDVRPKEVYIDDIDLIMRRVLGTEIKCATLSICD